MEGCILWTSETSNRAVSRFFLSKNSEIYSRVMDHLVHLFFKYCAVIIILTIFNITNLLKMKIVAGTLIQEPLGSKTQWQGWHTWQEWCTIEIMTWPYWWCGIDDVVIEVTWCVQFKWCGDVGLLNISEKIFSRAGKRNRQYFTHFSCDYLGILDLVVAVWTSTQ